MPLFFFFFFLIYIFLHERIFFLYKYGRKLKCPVSIKSKKKKRPFGEKKNRGIHFFSLSLLSYQELVVIHGSKTLNFFFFCALRMYVKKKTNYVVGRIFSAKDAKAKEFKYLSIPFYFRIY